nr:MAG TPA: hypothetical protein [Caudoviricetes sp.]
MRMIRFSDRYTLVNVAQVISSEDGMDLSELNHLPPIRIDSTRVTPKKALLEAIKVYHDFDNIIVTGIERCEDVYEMSSDDFKQVAKYRPVPVSGEFLPIN